MSRRIWVRFFLLQYVVLRRLVIIKWTVRVWLDCSVPIHNHSDLIILMLKNVFQMRFLSCPLYIIIFLLTKTYLILNKVLLFFSLRLCASLKVWSVLWESLKVISLWIFSQTNRNILRLALDLGNLSIISKICHFIFLRNCLIFAVIT